ncbi:Spy/CpxP family protein refolding chaperone [Sulfurospirillum arsenophilum]|uniref:Spy/CpxP family protein refolding chaperone n=1 Tax=Sulfurospirillum arsenophilum TaxID=56698 RepID=UPI0005AA6B73|nr:Spy/CpxP family protein refolding chaperone [Sulfurospirillum arsenophilum]
MKLLLLFLLAFSLYAGDGKKEHHLSKDLSSLELTSEQKEIAKGIIKQFRIDIKAFREFKEKMEDEKESLVMREVLNEDDLQKINQAISQKASTIESRFLVQMHNLLTPEQRKKFARNLEEWEVE